MSSFKELLKQINEPTQQDTLENQVADNPSDVDFLPVSDDLANLILMHRNAHFGSKFEFMLDYYQNDGVGCIQEIDVKDIKKLLEFEQKIKRDLASSKLSQLELEKVKNVLEIYSALRKLLNLSQDENSIPTLLAELILTEEENPSAIIEKLSKNKKSLTYLLDLLTSEEFLDPLFPGYGKAPQHVAACLGKMKAEKAIIPLFETMREDHFVHEEATIKALKEIGQPAFNFLMNVLQKEPFTSDNEKAAICLTRFENNEKFAKTSLDLLKNFQTLNFPNLVIHLILACQALKEPKDIEAFFRLEHQMPKSFGPDFQFVCSILKKKRSDLG